jgi:hypothetical protein
MTAYTDEMTEEFTAAQVAIEEEIMCNLVASKLTKTYQGEWAIVRAIYGKRDSQISDAEYQVVLHALRAVGKSKNIGWNEFVWKSA